MKLLLSARIKTRLWSTSHEVWLHQSSCLGTVSCTSEGSCGVADCLVFSQPGMELLVAPQHSPEHWRRPQLLHPTRPLANPTSQEFILWFLHLVWAEDCSEKSYFICIYGLGGLLPQPHGGPVREVLTPEHLKPFCLNLNFFFFHWLFFPTSISFLEMASGWYLETPSGKLYPSETFGPTQELSSWTPI